MYNKIALLIVEMASGCSSHNCTNLCGVISCSNRCTSNLILEQLIYDVCGYRFLLTVPFLAKLCTFPKRFIFSL